MIAAVISLGIVCLAQLGLFLWTYQQNAVERNALLDRIQAPDAPRLAALSDFAAEGREAPAAEELVPPIDMAWDDDLQLISTEDSL